MLAGWPNRFGLEFCTNKLDLARLGWNDDEDRATQSCVLYGIVSFKRAPSCLHECLSSSADDDEDNLSHVCFPLRPPLTH